MIKGIKYIGMPLQTGYGEAAKRAVLGLVNKSIPLTFTHEINKPMLDPELMPYYNLAIDYDTVIIHTVPEQFPEWIAQEKGKKIFGYTVWETDRVPQRWFPLLKDIPHLLVPSDWNRQVFINSGVNKPIDVYPHICLSSMPDSVDMLKYVAPDTFVFLTIGLYSSRKSIFNTIKAYLKAFTRTDNTLLVVKTNLYNLNRSIFGVHLFKTPQTIKLMSWRYPFAANIRLFTDTLSDAEILGLQKRADCYVSLCRSEGWGMGAFDAATLGKPVIMTGFGGQCDFLSPDLAYLVDYKVVPAIGKGFEKMIFGPEQNWAEPDVEHGAKLMRAVYEDRGAAKARATLLSQRIQENFNQQVVTDRLLSIISK